MFFCLLVFFFFFKWMVAVESMETSGSTCQTCVSVKELRKHSEISAYQGSCLDFVLSIILCNSCAILQKKSGCISVTCVKLLLFLVRNVFVNRTACRHAFKILHHYGKLLSKQGLKDGHRERVYSAL